MSPPSAKGKPKPLGTLKIQDICLICLHCEKPLKNLELDNYLEFFYEEMCSFSCKEKDKNLCSDCFETLQKCYHFRRQCEYSNKILKEWLKEDEETREKITQLHLKLESRNFENGDSDINTDTESLITDDELRDDKINIKTEKEQTLDEEVKIELFDIEDNLANASSDIENQSGEEDVTKDIDNNDDTLIVDEQFALNEDSLNENSTNTNAVYLLNANEESNSDDDIKTIKERIKLRKNSKRKVLTTKKKPLQNLHEYEKVFDIQLFSDDNKAKEEFVQRKFSKHYLVGEHKCEECYLVFQSEKHLKYHKNWHDVSKGEYVCDICPMRFSSRINVKDHKCNSHYGRFACKMCPLVTYHKTVMIEHYKKHTGCEFKCKICSKKFNHKSSLMTHLRLTHATQHVCGMCARTFVSEHGLKQHHYLMHKGAAAVGEDGVRCEQCNITFINKQVYLIHLSNSPKHPENKKRTKQKLVKKISCKLCDLKFDERSELVTHIKETHPTVKDKAPQIERICEVCKKQGLGNAWLYRHMSHEHPEVPYIPYHNYNKYLCSQCGKGFKALSLLSEHENIHTGLKPFPCEICHKAFRRKALLRIHKQTHEPAARECNECGKKFVSVANLNNHKRVHIGDKRYKCNSCGKGFINSGALNEHIKGVHLQIRRNKHTNKRRNNYIKAISLANDPIVNY